MKKVLSILLAALIAVSVLSAAITVSAAVNTPQTAYVMSLNKSEPFTFKYGYPTHEWEYSVYDTEVYYSFTPSTTGYYEFEVTGYDDDALRYPAGEAPRFSISIYDSVGEYVDYASTNTYSGKTIVAANLYANEKYNIKFYDSNVYELYSAQTGDYRYGEETVNFIVRKHTHVYDVNTYEYSSFTSATYRCRYCSYYYYANLYKPQTISLSKAAYTYDGKVKKPTVTVKDSKGKKIDSAYYNVSYSGGRKDVGKYTVKVKFKKEYEKYGTRSTTFKIVPKSTSLTGVSGARKAFTAKWKKQKTQTNGYQIQYATNSSFKSAKIVTVSNKNAASKKVTGLKSKKNYYVRVRTYKTVSGTKYCSGWSAKKKVKTK